MFSKVLFNITYKSCLTSYFATTSNLLSAFESDLYFKAGFILAYCVVHGGGAGTQIMSPLLYAMVSGMKPMPTLADVEGDIRKELKEVCNHSIVE